MTLAPRPWIRAPWRPHTALLFLAALGVVMRVWHGWNAAWYWDEGYFAQVARDLGHGLRPRVGALWEDGFFPLSTSWLAPLSAAPFTRIPTLDPLQAVRLWAALLGGLGAYLLGRLAWRLTGPQLGLATAAAFALGPPTVALGGLGLYHGLGTVLALAAIWARVTAGDDPEPGSGRVWLALGLAGLAWASCYWLWWLLLSLGLSLRARARHWALPFLLLGAGPLALVLGMQVAGGGEAARFNAASLLHSAHSAFKALELLAVPRDQPLAWLGVAGLCLLPRGRRWLALGAALGLADLLRQRGEINANSYALLPLLPLLCLGLILLAARAWAVGGARGRWLGVAVIALGLGRFKHDGLQALSLRPEEGRALAAALQERSPAGSLVIGLPPLDWTLTPRLRSAEPAQVLAAQGWTGGHLRAGLPASAFAYPVRLEDARYYVSTWVHHQSLYPVHSLALPALRAEFEGWPLVLQGPSFAVYGNPRAGFRRDPKSRILYFRSAYERAAEDAAALELPALAAFARRRAATGLPDPPADR